MSGVEAARHQLLKVTEDLEFLLGDDPDQPVPQDEHFTRQRPDEGAREMSFVNSKKKMAVASSWACLMRSSAVLMITALAMLIAVRWSSAHAPKRSSLLEGSSNPSVLLDDNGSNFTRVFGIDSNESTSQSDEISNSSHSAKVLSSGTNGSYDAEASNSTNKSYDDEASNNTNKSRSLNDTLSPHCGEVQPPPPGGKCSVTVLHLSDTHQLHWHLDGQFPLPKADIMLFTGDLSNLGNDGEFRNFNSWIRHIKPRFKHIFVIVGNHDWFNTLDRVDRRQLTPQQVLETDYMQRKMPDVKVLHHELVEAEGLRIYGSTFDPWFGGRTPGDPGYSMELAPNFKRARPRKRVFDAWAAMSDNSKYTNNYHKIPNGVDILLTHGPPFQVLDRTKYGRWGSSKELRKAIERTKPKVHLFGHVHEQRGKWRRVGSSLQGGVEYQPSNNGKVFLPPVPKEGIRWFQADPPSTKHVPDMTCNTALMNNALVDKEWGQTPVNRIKAPARLLRAEWKGGRWQFS